MSLYRLNIASRRINLYLSREEIVLSWRGFRPELTSISRKKRKGSNSSDCLGLTVPTLLVDYSIRSTEESYPDQVFGRSTVFVSLSGVGTNTIVRREAFPALPVSSFPRWRGGWPAIRRPKRLSRSQSGGRSRCHSVKVPLPGNPS